jgi:hypothetical protein
MTKEQSATTTVHDGTLTGKEQAEPAYEYKISSLKINNLTVNVKSRFYHEKSLDDILFSIASLKLKEKSS